jgi:hypothetical protein
VQKALKLTPDQTRRAVEIVRQANREAQAEADQHEKTPEGKAEVARREEAFKAQGMPAEFARLTRRVNLDPALRRADERVKTILTAEQWARLRQYSYQWRGWRALSDPDLAAALNLDEPTIAVIKELRQEQGHIRQQYADRLRYKGDGNPDRSKAKVADVVRDYHAADAALEREALRLLTKRQREKYQSMLGPPFDFLPVPDPTEHAPVAPR